MAYKPSFTFTNDDREARRCSSVSTSKSAENCAVPYGGGVSGNTCGCRVSDVAGLAVDEADPDASTGRFLRCRGRYTVPATMHIIPDVPATLQLIPDASRILRAAKSRSRCLRPVMKGS